MSTVAAGRDGTCLRRKVMQRLIVKDNLLCYGLTFISASTTYAGSASEAEKSFSPHLLKRSSLKMPEVQILVTYVLLLSAAVSLGVLLKCIDSFEGESLSQHLGENEPTRSQTYA